MRGGRTEWLAGRLEGLAPHQKLNMRVGDLIDLLAEIDQGNAERDRWVARIKALEARLVDIVRIASGVKG